VEIELNATESHVVLEIRDNGRGITDKEIVASKSLGLLGIRERAFLLGGEVHFSGSPGKGTTVNLQMPRAG
jgi:signal transduction histidine kinase